MGAVTLDILAAGKVAAPIYAAVHFPNLKWALGRRYHLERPRHLEKYISKGFTLYPMVLHYIQVLKNKNFQADT